MIMKLNTWMYSSAWADKIDIDVDVILMLSASHSFPLGCYSVHVLKAVALASLATCPLNCIGTVMMVLLWMHYILWILCVVIGILTDSPLSPCLPRGPTGPGEPVAPGAPGAPTGPVLPRSPYRRTHGTDTETTVHYAHAPMRELCNKYSLLSGS